MPFDILIERKIMVNLLNLRMNSFVFCKGNDGRDKCGLKLFCDISKQRVDGVFSVLGLTHL